MECRRDIQNYQLKCNQYVLGMAENRIPRKALQYRPQGKRDLGRQKSLEIPVHVVAERELITQNCEWKKKKKNRNCNFNSREKLEHENKALSSLSHQTNFVFIYLFILMF